MTGSVIPLPTQASLQLRSNIAQLISSKRRIQPRVPFFKLACHRIPTLWNLYRNLLRVSPTDNIRWRVKKIFEREQHRTSAVRAQKYLAQGYKWLDTFRKAKYDHHEHFQRVVKRYDAIIAMKREQSFWRRLAKNEKNWRDKLARRPIVKPSILRASILNRPLPRLTPQPLKIHYMIKWRINQRQKRTDRLAELEEARQDIQIEAALEKGLAGYMGEKKKLSDPAMGYMYSSSASYQQWLEPIRDTVKGIQKTFDNDSAREKAPYTPELLAAIEAAKREKYQNKAREHRRELQGEVLTATIKRARKCPPAHILAKMSPTHRYLDALARRGVSQVGRVGEAKKRLGYKIRVPPELFKAEVGGVDPQRRAELNKECFRLMEVMRERRTQAEHEMKALERTGEALDRARRKKGGLQ